MQGPLIDRLYRRDFNCQTQRIPPHPTPTPDPVHATFRLSELVLCQAAVSPALQSMHKTLKQSLKQLTVVDFL